MQNYAKLCERSLLTKLKLYRDHRCESIRDTHYSMPIVIKVSSETVLIYIAYQMGIHRGESQDLSQVTDVSQSNRRKNAHLGERSSVDSCQRCFGHGTLVTSGVWTLLYEFDDKGSVFATNISY